MKDYDVVVVGGGVSGLVAAYETSKRNLKVAIIEPNALGGMLQTKYEGGYQLEAAAQILTAKPALTNLCKDLGIELQFPRASTNWQAVFVEGTQISFRKSLFSLLSSGALPISEAVHAVKNLLLPDNRFALEDDMSVAEFVRLLFGPSTCARLLNPVFRGIYGGRSEEQSASWIFGSLWDRLRKSKFRRTAGEKGEPCRILGGNYLLVKRLLEIVEQTVDVTKAKVLSIGSRAKGLILKTDSGNICTTKVIWTAEPNVFGIADTEYTPITVVQASCDSLPAKLRDHLGILFAENTFEPLLGIMCYSELFEGVAPAGKQLLCLMFGGEDALKWRQNEALSWIKTGLSKRLEFPNLDVINITPWSKAIPVYKVGYLNKIKEYQSIEKRFPGVIMAGRVSSKPGVSERIHSALRACEAAKFNLLNDYRAEGHF